MTAERRASGLLRVPFVRRCWLQVGEAPPTTAFLVNISVFGGYVARDELPPLGLRVTCRFRVPDSEQEVALLAVVAWLNAKQSHPVHSLPPGFGLKFESLSAEARRQIERIVSEHVSRPSGPR